MKTRILLSLLLTLISLTGFCATWTITTSGFTFTPSTITIASGDNVNFSLTSIHNALEVSQETWNNNDITPLAGGFQTAFGGGLVLAAQLTVGTHWYVCQNHAMSGMKGIIIVSALSLPEYQKTSNFSISPNPTSDFITVKANENIFGSPYTIQDETGRKVVEGSLADVKTVVDISLLSNGVYFFQIGEDRKQTVRIIKR